MLNTSQGITGNVQECFSSKKWCNIKHDWIVIYENYHIYQPHNLCWSLFVSAGTDHERRRNYCIGNFLASNILVHGNWWPVVFSGVLWGIFIFAKLTKSCFVLNSPDHLFVSIVTDISSSQLYIKNNEESSQILLGISQLFFYTINEYSQVQSLQSTKALDFVLHSFPFVKMSWINARR